MMPLPNPARDLKEAQSCLTESGVCIIPDALSKDELEQARYAFYREIEDDNKNDNVITGFALDPDDLNQRLWNLLARDQCFVHMVEHPIALALVRHVLGWPALLSNISGNLTIPGSRQGGLHADQIFVPEPWPDEPQGMIVAWCLDDLTEENGATEVILGSHRWNHHPRKDDAEIEMTKVIAQAGSLVAFESRVWHRTGENSSKDKTRALVLPFYTKPIYRTQENWFLTLNNKFIEKASDDLLTLLAYKSDGLGLVYGRSPK
jgi:ectoine hydroxylase-related dioxygenase (phytanoyl-CoA dioxygenase family)